MKPRPRKQRSNHATAMVGVMLVLFGLTAIAVLGILESNGVRRMGGDVASDSGNELNRTNSRGNRYQAQVLSESGVRLALQWLVQQTQTPTNTSAFAPSSVASFYGATATGNNWSQLTVASGPSASQLSSVPQVDGTIKVKFYPYNTNATSGAQKMFAVESVGTYQGFTYLCRVFVRQNTFARYAYFSDKSPTSWWVSGLTRFQGPVHINGTNATGTGVDPTALLNIIWRRNTLTVDQTRLFTYPDGDYFTTSMAASQLKWYRATSTATTLSTPSSSYWTWVTAAASAPQTGMPMVTMPGANTQQQLAALGSATAMTSVGVQVPGTGTPSAGIYVNGDVRDFNLRTAGTANTTQILELYQYNPSTTKDVRTTITIDPVANSTVVKVENRSNPTNTWNISSSGTWSTLSTTSYTGTPNGVVYVNGDIGEQTGLRRGGLAGAIANSVVDGSGNVSEPFSLNIVTEGTKGININGGIVYQNLISNSSNANNLLSTSAAPATASGMLGIVAGDIQIVDNDDGGNALTNVSIHGACMAYNTFDATNPTTRTIGAFNLIGGYIVQTNGTFGTALPDGTQQSGFLVNRNYDQRLADSPPPAYPATQKSYQIVSYQRAVASLAP